VVARVGQHLHAVLLVVGVQVLGHCLEAAPLECLPRVNA
jgi:hypothetical protein